MTTKTRSYTQDGVTAELWSYDSVRVKMRWQDFYRQFPIQNGGLSVSVHAFFALFVVTVTDLRFDKDMAEWATELKSWWEAHRADIEASRYKAAWEAFLDLDGDAVLSFINRAYDRTRRDYVPASEELRLDETDTQDEGFLADAESVSLTSA